MQLMSVGQITNHDCHVILDPDVCYIQDRRTGLFVHVSPHGRILLLLYMDDMIITVDNPEYIAFVKARLSDQFLMSDLGPLRYFLGIEISSTPEGFFLS
jgi:hypothetical protein